MFISFGYLSKKMLIPILIPILYSIRHYLLNIFDQKIKASESKKQSVFLNTFIISIIYSLNIFLLIIEYYKTKSSQKTIQQNDYNNQLIIEKNKMERKQKLYTNIILILLPLFNFFNFLSYDILNIFKPGDYNRIYFYPISIPIYFIITAILSHIFLNYKFYCHQKTTMIISPLLSLTLLSFLILLNNDDKKSNSSVNSILFLIQCLILKSLRYVVFIFGKLFMEKMFVSHIKLMTFLGIFGIVFSLITNYLSFYINLKFIDNTNLNDYFVITNDFKRFKNIFDKWGDFGEYNWVILILISIIILWFAENYVSWFCVYTFSPNHFTIYSSICVILELLFELIGFKEYNVKIIVLCILSVLVHFLIFISSLIFNEILIIRICKMDQNTNVEINKRQKEEIENMVNKRETLSSNNNSLYELDSLGGENRSSKIDKNFSNSFLSYKE